MQDEASWKPFWKVRVCMPGSIIHVASQTEPVIEMDGGRVANVIMTPLATDDYGDTVGFIDWPAAVAVTWRLQTPSASSEPVEESSAPISLRAKRARR